MKGHVQIMNNCVILVRFKYFPKHYFQTLVIYGFLSKNPYFTPI
jgi:hypothetical protein